MFMMSLTVFHARRAAPALALLACAALCPPGVAAPGAKKGAAKKPSAPPNLSAVAESPTMTIGDPKLPGKRLAVVKADGLSGDSGGGGVLGTMTQVHALLFHQGKEEATLYAPAAHFSQNNATGNVVAVGTGGVVINSLMEPGTRLTAGRRHLVCRPQPDRGDRARRLSQGQGEPHPPVADDDRGHGPELVPHRRGQAVRQILGTALSRGRARRRGADLRTFCTETVFSSRLFSWPSYRRPGCSPPCGLCPRRPGPACPRPCPSSGR